MPSKKVIILTLTLLIVISAFIFYTLGANGGEGSVDNTSPGGGEQALVSKLEKLEAGMYNGTLKIGETETSPGEPLVYVGAPPDKAEVVVMIFYDMKCPYCAIEFKNASDVLVKYLEEYDNVSLVLVGLVIHDDAKEYHGYIRCIASQGAPVLAILYEYYSTALDQKAWPSLEELKNIASKYGEWNVSTDCIQKQLVSLAKIDIWSLDTLQIQGTPTVIVQSKKLQTAYVSTGVTDPAKLDSLLSSLVKGEEPNLDSQG